MHAISATQIKAARAMLDWSQGDLAVATGLSDSTIGNIESGVMSPRRATSGLIRRTLENAGLEFMDAEGVRLRRNDVRVYEGHDSCEQLMRDVRRAVMDHGGEVLVLLRTPQERIHFYREQFEALQDLSAIVCVKNIVATAFAVPEVTNTFSFRMAPVTVMGAVSFIVYGNACALVLMDGLGQFKFVVFRLTGFVQDYRAFFNELWQQALPLAVPVAHEERRLVAR